MLPKRERISDRRKIKEVLKKRQIHFSSPLLSLTAEENNFSFNRAAVTCSKKLGNAVVRNKIKRKMMADIANIWRNNSKNYDVVIVPRAKEASLEIVADAVRRKLI